MKPYLSAQACPCGRMAHRAPSTFGACCGRWIESDVAAPDAESLMRSRYTAFVLEREPYLLATWHPDTRPAEVLFEKGARWLGLEVRRHTVLGDDRAEVEFVARQKPLGGAALRLHECSRFVLLEGRWLYTDGDQR